MFSLGVKIQILIFLLLAFVSLYVIVLQKEMKLMQTEIAMMKINFNHNDGNVDRQQQQQCENPKKCRRTSNSSEVCHITAIHEDEDGDDVSVSSNDIKNILTNITNIGDDADHESTHDEDIDLSLLTLNELDKLKVDVLKKYLNKKNIKFSKACKKAELIRLIREDVENNTDEVVVNISL